MTPEELVEFFRQRGSDVVRTASSWWYEEQRGTRVYYSFPAHRLIDPRPTEISEVFRLLPRAMAIRFLTPDTTRHSRTSIWLRRAPYNLSVLTSKARNQARRGLEACQVRKLDWRELIENARAAHADTMNRRGAEDNSSLGIGPDLAACPAYEAWGAFISGNLAAYAVTVTVDDWAHILLQRSVSANLKARPNNALIFTLTAGMLARPDISTVSYGLDPLAALDSLDHFKAGMGFVKETVGHRIVLAPRFRPVVNRVTIKPLIALAELMPNNARLQKIAGFCSVASYQ